MPEHSVIGGDEHLAVAISFDIDRAAEKGAEFFALFEKNLKLLWRDTVMECLAEMKRRAPVGATNYQIEWGGKPSSPRARQAEGHPIRKIAGGTLRRSLTVVLWAFAKEVWEAQLGVPEDSGAAKYARMREFGGIITAKRKWLVFSPDGKIIVRVKSVHQQAQPYAIPAMLYIWPKLIELPAVAFEMTAGLWGDAGI